MRFRLFLSLFAVVLIFAPSGEASLGSTEHAWANGAARVCWTDDIARVNREAAILGMRPTRIALPTTAENKAVRELLATAFTKDRIGFEFRGFSKCDPLAEVDALMLFNTDFADHRILGQATPGDYTARTGAVNRIESRFSGVKKKSAVAFDQGNIDAEIAELVRSTLDYAKVRMTAEDRERPETKAALQDFSDNLRRDLWRLATLHEFGHLAGLLHEERRKDFGDEQPKFCFGVFSQLAQAPDERREAPRDGESRLGTAYDPFSVMNYCRKSAQIIYRRSALLCSLGNALVSGMKRLAQKTGAVEKLLARCSFIAQNPLEVDLSPRDEAGLRFLYRKETPAGVARDYKDSKIERDWLEVLDVGSRIFF